MRFRLLMASGWVVGGTMLFSVLCGKVHAALLVEEEFNYGVGTNNLAGLNGGTGFAGAWNDDAGMGTFKYVPSGLTFGSLLTAAGAAQVGTVSNIASNPFRAQASRPLDLGALVVGSVYGSYLFSIPYFNNGADSLALLFGGINTTNTGLGGSPDNYSQQDMAGLYYNGGSKGNVRLVGNGGSVSGSTITTNTTYLALWQADGMVASGSGPETLTLWVLTADQFTNLKALGLSKELLNATALGSTSSNILERATLTGTYAATFLQNCLVSLYATFKSNVTPLGMTFDEIRVGTDSLDGVTPVSTPTWAPPQITQAPSSIAIFVGGTVNFGVGATGFPSPNYQWLVGSVGSGQHHPVAGGGRISGATNFTLTISNVTLADMADYVVVVSNSFGAVTSSPPATLTISNYPTNSVPPWALGPFMRPLNGVNPIISSNPDALFNDPILGQPINWEYTHTFNPAAVAKEDRVYVLYRAEDNSGTGIGSFTSRLGLAASADGLNFICNQTPIFYPENDDQETNEWPGGCEDPRVVETEGGTYVLLYTQWNHSVARLGVATSTNMIDWVKHGSPFALYGNASVNQNSHSKSAAIVTKLVDGRLKATKISGKYWLYWGDGTVYTASSDDLINWLPGPAVLSTRSGMFDASLCEGGPPPILTRDGIVVLYNGENGNPGDTNVGPNAYSGGQALFDAKEPAKLVARMDHPFFQPQAPYEITGQYGSGTTFIEGLVAFQNQWYLYYGAADTFVGVATCVNTNYGLTETFPTNDYYQDFDGFSVGSTNYLDGSTLLSTVLGSVAGVQDSFQRELQLTSGGASNVTSAFLLPDIAAGKSVYGFSARWVSQFYYTNISAGGLSFDLSPVAGDGILDLPVEQGYGAGLSVSVDNNKSGSAGFYLRVGNTIVAQQNFDPDTQWGRGNAFRNYFSVDWNYLDGLTFSMNGAIIFSNVPTTGFVPEPGMTFSWAARAGNNAEEVRVDDIAVLANANLAPVLLEPDYGANGSTSGNDVSNAFDGNANTQWQTASSNGWISVVCAGGSQKVTAYAMTSADAGWQQDPRDWKLQGSNDGTNWLTVDSEYAMGWENSDGTMRRVPRTFLVSQPAAYNEYRLNISTNNGAVNTQLAELMLYTSSPVQPPVPVFAETHLVTHDLITRGYGGLPLGEYFILTATNLLQPTDQWTAIASNRFDAAGNFAFTNVICAGAPETFYRLKTP